MRFTKGWEKGWSGVWKNWIIALLLLFVLLAVVWDLRRRELPHRLTYGAVGVFLLLHALAGSFWLSLIGALGMGRIKVAPGDFRSHVRSRHGTVHGAGGRPGLSVGGSRRHDDRGFGLGAWEKGRRVERALSAESAPSRAGRAFGGACGRAGDGGRVGGRIGALNARKPPCTGWAGRRGRLNRLGDATAAGARNGG